MRFRFFILLVAFVVGTGSGDAQTMPSPDAVRGLLESVDTKDQAWGAWWAAQGKMRELEPQLRKNLEARFNSRAWKDAIVTDTTLDAFVQFGSDSLPVDLLQSIYPAGRAQVLILLSEPNRPRALVDSFMLKLLDDEAKRGQGMEWFTAADILLSHKTPGFVGAILKDLHITASVTICDAGQSCTTSRGGSGSAGDGFVIMDSGYPPWPRYALTSPGVPPPGNIFLQPPGAATTIAYRRYLYPDGGVTQFIVGSTSVYPPHPTTAERMNYVVAAAPGLQIQIRDNESIETAWSDHAAYATTLEQFRQSIVQRYSSMITQLSTRGLLSADEAVAFLTPHIEVIVDDRRAVKTPL